MTPVADGVRWPARTRCGTHLPVNAVSLRIAVTFVVAFVVAVVVASLLSACDHAPPALVGGNGSDGNGTGTGGNGSGGGGNDLSITISDGGIVVPDGGMPTNCTLGASGALGLVPVDTMAPGTACVACHLAIGKPLYLAGTVYPTYHDPDLCLGVTDVQIELVDANHATHMLPVNSSGNFLDQDIFSLWPSPWTVAVVRGSARRPMVGTVTDGDCNGCHTATGNNAAPGRILAPDPDPQM